MVVPFYNEQAVLPYALKRLAPVIRDFPDPAELILVDDGSTDQSGAVAGGFAASLPALRMVRLPRHTGYGAALRAGFGAAQYDIAGYTDSDLPVDPSIWQTAVAEMRRRNLDLYLGCRQPRIDSGPYRNFQSFIYNRLIKHLFGVQVRDVNFSCKLLKTELLPRLDLHADGPFFDAELLVKVWRLGLGFAEFPVTPLPRSAGRSTLGNPRAVRAILRELLAFYRRQ